MVKYEWVDIEIYDRVDDETTIYTQEMLERITCNRTNEDKFEAVQYEDDRPQFWFTQNHVCWVDTSHAWSDRLIILPRGY